MTDSPQPPDREISIMVSPRAGQVQGVVRGPADPRFFLVLAHGAGAGMRHHFLESLASALAQAGVATLRFEFPYMQKGRGRPDVPAVLHATVRAAVNAAGLLAEGRPLFAGGKSMGGRMTSQAQSARPLHGVLGLVFFGFPLHPAGQPSVERADHLSGVHVPMLFHQGTSDRLADPDLLRPVLARLAGRATLNLVDQANHDFSLPARMGIGTAEVSLQMAGQTARWMARIVSLSR